jgi:hypothetical protein
MGRIGTAPLDAQFAFISAHGHDNRRLSKSELVPGGTS